MNEATYSYSAFLFFNKNALRLANWRKLLEGLGLIIGNGRLHATPTRSTRVKFSVRRREARVRMVFRSRKYECYAVVRSAYCSHFAVRSNRFPAFASEFKDAGLPRAKLVAASNKPAKRPWKIWDERWKSYLGYLKPRTDLQQIAANGGNEQSA